MTLSTFRLASDHALLTLNVSDHALLTLNVFKTLDHNVSQLPACMCLWLQCTCMLTDLALNPETSPYMSPTSYIVRSWPFATL